METVVKFADKAALHSCWSPQMRAMGMDPSAADSMMSMMAGNPAMLKMMQDQVQ